MSSFWDDATVTTKYVLKQIAAGILDSIITCLIGSPIASSWDYINGSIASTDVLIITTVAECMGVTLYFMLFIL